MTIPAAATYAEEERMLLDLVDKFVENELMPLEKDIMAREAAGEKWSLTEEEEAPLLAKCKELGLWALDAPEDRSEMTDPAGIARLSLRSPPGGAGLLAGPRVGLRPVVTDAHDADGVDGGLVS